MKTYEQAASKLNDDIECYQLSVVAQGEKIKAQYEIIEKMEIVLRKSDDQLLEYYKGNSVSTCANHELAKEILEALTLLREHKEKYK